MSDKKFLRAPSMMVLLALGLGLFIAWAANFEIDQGVRAQGQIISNARTQIIQAVDGGVLSELRVVEGQQVKLGEVLAVLEKNRAEARAIMEKLGYSATNTLKVKISTRNIPAYRDPAVILIDNLKQIHVEGELEPVETSLWFSKVARKDYAVGLNLTGNAVDDPDQTFYENYACKSERNYSEYCNPELEKAFDAQSSEIDVEKRKKMVWAIDQQIQNDVARPIIYHIRAGTCWQPNLQGFTPMVNSGYNGYRFEDIWLKK